MKKKAFPLISLILLPVIAFCQNFQYSTVVLKTVTFSNGLSIQKDDGSGAYLSPQWNSNSSIPAPVAYISGKAPTVSATFSFSCSNAPASVWLKGSGPESMEFPSMKVTVGSASPHSIMYPATAGSIVFTAGVVRFFKPYTINWQISFDGINWRSAGTSGNTLYVTKTAPQAEFSNADFKWYHTVFDISCRNADKKSTEANIISSVWSEFTDHVVLNWNGDSLFYYKSMNSPNVTLGSLLKYRDAECFTFAQLFLSLIKIQGIVRTNNYINIEADGSSGCNGYPIDCFLVKDWIFGAASSGCTDFPYENTYATLMAYPYTSYNFIKTDVKDAAGAPGVCTKNPASFFNNHQISKIDGVYYDACYGLTFNKVTDIKTTAFSAWCCRFVDGNGIVHALFTKNMSLADLYETVETY
jgi:hypothetical protein